MKKIFVFLLLMVVSFAVKAQYPITQNLGADSTLIYVKGAVRTVGGFINGTYIDTAAANLTRIRQYQAAQIFTTGDSAIWFRMPGATKWVRIMPATPPSPNVDTSYWSLSGNYVADRVATPRLGTTTGHELNIITNDSIRLTIPVYGIRRVTGNENRYLVIDTTIGSNMYVGYMDGGSGSSYTAGNGLTLSGSQFKLGGTLTEPTTITGDATNKLVLQGYNASNDGYLNIGQDKGWLQFGSGAFSPLYESEIYSGPLELGLRTSGNIYLNAGDIYTIGVPTVSSTTGRKVALIDTATGKVERIDPASLGNSFSFGDTLFVNNISAIPTNEPEYEIAVFPDIQNMVRWSWAYGRPMYTWLRDSAAYYNVKAMVQVGDITDWNTQAEWDTVEAWNNYLPTNLPVLYVPGNHDYGTGFNPSGRDATRYKTEIANFYASRTGTTYGTYNSSPENNYMSFNAGSKKYFVLGLEFIPRDAVVTWASNVLDSLYSADPDREVIVVTHSYIDEKGERAKDTSDYSAAHYGMSADNDGQELWDKLIRKKKNIKWVFSGHHLIYNVDANKGLTQRIVSVGDHGNLINQIFVNYQDDVFWGDGYMLRLRFKPSEGTVTARFYSAYYNADDSRVASYVLEDPAINMASSVGVKTDLSVGRDLRVGGKLKVETLFPNRLVFSDSDGVVMGDAGLSFDKFNRKLNFPGGVINYPYTYLSIPSGQDQKLFSFRDSTGMELFYIKSFRASKTSFPSLHSNILIGDSLGVPYGWNNSLIGTHLIAKAQWAAVANTTSNALQGSQIGANVTGNFRWNVMMGQDLFNLATSGDDLTLIGQNVGNSMSGGTKVSALGSSAFSGLAVPVPISYSSGVGGNNFYNTASSYSVGVGYATGRNSSGDSAVLLGNRAGDGWTSIRQKLVIANSNTTSPLIYGEFDTPKVVINGRFEATDTAKFAKLRVTASPTAGYVLTSDADGNATWQPSSGGGTPGGSTKQFQYNNAGAFAGSGMLTQETNQILVTGVSDATTIPFAVEAHEDLTAPIIVAAQSGVKKIALHSNGSIEMQEVTDPTAAATGYNRLYAQAGKLYTHNDDGRVAQVIQNLQLVFGAGSGADADTTAFTTSAIYGSFYNDADTIVVTSMRSVLQGTSPDVTYKVWYNDSLNVEAGATALVTAGNQVTNTTTGTNVTSFDVTKIPPGVWVWVKTSTVATKPKYFSLTLNGYRK